MDSERSHHGVLVIVRDALGVLQRQRSQCVQSSLYFCRLSEAQRRVWRVRRSICSSVFHVQWSCVFACSPYMIVYASRSLLLCSSFGYAGSPFRHANTASTLFHTAILVSFLFFCLYNCVILMVGKQSETIGLCCLQAQDVQGGPSKVWMRRYKTAVEMNKRFPTTSFWLATTHTHPHRDVFTWRKCHRLLWCVKMWTDVGDEN